MRENFLFFHTVVFQKKNQEKNWFFHGKFVVRIAYWVLQKKEGNNSTMWKLRGFTFTLMHFWQKFRDSNSFTKEITK